MRLLQFRISTWPAFTALLAAFLVSGCTHPRSAQEIADAGGLAAANQKAADAKAKAQMPPAPSSSVSVGKVSWASRVESMGVISLKGAPLPAGTLLVARTGELDPVCIMRTTETARGHTQGVILLNGVPNTGDNVVVPGPEYDSLIRANFDLNDRHQDANSFRAAGTAAPTMVPGQ